MLIKILCNYYQHKNFQNQEQHKQILNQNINGSHLINIIHSYITNS